MDLILLTQNQTAIFKYIVWVLGKLMELIFNFLCVIKIPNIGLAIILFTIIIYLLMMPLTIKQQKFSKLSAKMNPEIQAIQKKYKGKQDQASMMAMNQETKAVYAKYGVSPSGSCLQLLIQMPILFALYKVIYQMPAYVGKIRDVFIPVTNLLSKEDITFFSENISSYSYYKKQFTEAAISEGGKYQDITSSFIDVLNRASTSDWNKIIEKYGDVANTAHNSLLKFNNFLGLNIGDAPSQIIKNAMSDGKILVVIGAILIPLLAAFTQWVNVKLAPQSQTNSDPNNQSDTAAAMASSMKTMNTVMPLMSAVFCFTLPAGMGLYWIAGAVVRTVQQVIINKHIDKMDIDGMIQANIEKYNEKAKKAGVPTAQLNANANLSTKNINSNKSSKPSMTQEEKDEAVRKATEYYSKNAKPGSLAAKANMVKAYNEKNNKD